MHPRIVVNEVCYPAMALADKLAHWKASGIDRVGLARFRRPGLSWDEELPAVLDAGIAVGYLLHAPMYHLDDKSSWAASTDALVVTVDAARMHGVPTIYTTTGPKGALSFEQAAAALAEAVQPAVEHAQRQGVELLVETANPLFAHTHFLHTLADTVAVAEQCGLGVCLDVHAVWTESALDQRIAQAGTRLGLVQVSDFVPNQGTVARDVIGDGIIPLEQILRSILATGYAGLFDLELYARPPETAVDDTRISVERLGVLLDTVGARP